MTAPVKPPHLLSYGLLLLAVFASAFCLIIEFDVPWYLRAGEEILRRGALPEQDPFSYTASKPWLNHIWLWHIALHAVHRVGGMLGLTICQALVLTLTVAALIWAHAQQRPGRVAEEGALAGLAPLAYVTAAMLLREIISPRAQLVSNLLFALTLALVLRDASAPRSSEERPPERLYLVLLVGLVWTQVHGGSPHNFILVFLLFVSGPSWRRGLYALGALAMTCVGPYGIRVHEHFFGATGAFPAIREWHSLLAALRIDLAAHLPYVVFLALGVAALILRLRRKENVRFLALALGFYTLAAVVYVRFLNEATLVAVTVLAPSLTGALPAVRQRLRGAFAPLVLVVALAIVGVSVLGSSRVLGVGLAPWRFPIAAVAHLRETRPPGPMFNSYNFGGYLIWAYPQEQVFIDGRAFTVYSPRHLQQLLEVYSAPPRFLELQRRYGFRLAVLQRRGRGAAFLAWLRRQPDWRVTHEDRVAAVLVSSRRIGAPAPAGPGGAESIKP